jgi:cytoskeleton protein RodZ
MRSLSDVLIRNREEKGLTIAQVAYETNISKKFIEALEEENFEAFPAEAYLLGFLRNYGEFLGLEYETLLAEYKNCLLREEPTPLSELMGSTRTFEFRLWMVLVPVIILALFFGVPPIVKVVGGQIEKRKEALRLVGENKSKRFPVESEYYDQKVKIGDAWTLQIGEEVLVYEIREINSDLIVTEAFRAEERVITLKLGSEIITEFTDNSTQYIVTLLLKDIGGFSDNSAVMKVKVDEKEVAVVDESDLDAIIEQASGKESRVLMVKKRSPDPYSISIKFEGDILFRYQQLGQELKENFYQKDSVLTMDVTRSIQIWTSNAGLTKFKLNGEIIVLGRTGEVHVFSLRWIYIKEKDEYRLEYATAY